MALKSEKIIYWPSMALQCCGSGELIAAEFRREKKKKKKKQKKEIKKVPSTAIMRENNNADHRRYFGLFMTHGTLGSSLISGSMIFIFI